jgi:tRNA threonylcarbamoyladenosine biosynthesis protein TsaB
VLLAIDTSTQMTGLALYDGTRVLCEMTWQSRNHHTVELSPAIGELLERCGSRPADIQALGVALGPGSFTSLRIGLALAKGMALALKIPVIGVPTLDVLAAGVPPVWPGSGEMPLAALLQAGRGRLALVWYRVQEGTWQVQSAPQIVTVEELSQKILKPTLVAGELSAAERQILARKRKNVTLLSPAQALRRPGYLAEIAWERWHAGHVDDVVALAPIYLHVAEAIPD